MEDNRWDDHLRDLLGEHKPGEIPSSPMPVPPGLDPASDKSLQDQNWKRIEASLDAADHAFDENMRRKVAHYHAPYDHASWPVFVQRFADHQFLRARLVMLKMIEVAALLLLLITAVKLGFVTDLNPSQPEDQIIPGNFTQAPVLDKESPGINAQTNLPGEKKTFASTNENALAADATHAIQRTGNNTSRSSSNNDHFPGAFSQNGSTTANTLWKASSQGNSPVSQSRKDATGNLFAGNLLTEYKATASLPAIDINAKETADGAMAIGDIIPAHTAYITNPISSLEGDIDFENAVTVPRSKYIKPKARKYTEFAVLAQSDYNGLRMPEDRLFTSGQQIVFPQQGIMSHGFGGGFTIALGHPRWAIETGLIYSAKDFKPGRQLIVGGVFDNGRIDFQAMRMQIVSMPFHYRYRFDDQGRMKFYGLVGGGLNLIVRSDVDVQIKYSFTSQAAGGNSYADPAQEETIRESRRIKEHIRDGAPFSTKSFLSLNGGIGVEYLISEYKTLFLQGTAIYQIPDLEFSNNNGKHLRTVSLQAGVRTPLGR